MAVEYSCIPSSTGSFSLILICLALPFHVLIAKILAKDLDLCLPRHKILFCVSISDGLQIAVTALLTSIMRTLHLTTASDVCLLLRKITLFNAVTTYVVSSLSLVALSVERYVACVHSFRLYEYLTNRRVYSALVLFWVLGCVLGIYAVLVDDIASKETIVGETKSFQIIASSVTLVTTAIISVVQVVLFRLSQKKLSQVSPTAFGSDAEYSELWKKQIKVAVIAGMVVLAYIICMLPLAIVFTLDLCGAVAIDTSLRTSVVAFAMANTLADPFIYGIGILDTRRAIKKHIRYITNFVRDRY